MVKAYPDLERGESASETHRKHIPTRVFKQAVKLTKQMSAITAALEGINPLNAGRRRDEALALLKKFFPGMEDFEKQVRKYKREISQLEKSNAELEKQVETNEQKAKASENARKSKQLATAQLQADYYNLKRFVDTLPEEIRQQAQQQQQRKPQQQTR
jgi:chromosome segregation ATPase